VPGPTVEDVFELSPLQQGMLFHSVIDSDARLYLEQVCLTFTGVISIEVFRETWNKIVRRHQVLRVAFFWEKIDKPVQLVHGNAEMRVHHDDWSTLSPADQLARLQLYLQTDRVQGLNLSKPPLMHIALFKLAPATHQFVATFHHGILDGWSLNLLFKEFAHIYPMLLRGAQPEHSPAIPYSRFIAWLAQQNATAAEAFWRRYLAGYDGPARLWTGMQTPGHAPAQGFGEKQIRLGIKLTEELTQLARRAKVTLNVVIQAAWAIVLSGRADAGDIVFGSVVSGRPPEFDGIETMVGLFINTLPVRARVEPDLPLSALLTELHRQQLEARQFEYCSLVQIQGWSGVPRGTPLFESLFIFENLPGTTGTANLEVGAYALERTNYPLTVLVMPGASIDIKLLFMVPHATETAAETLLDQLRRVLQAAATDPGASIGQLPLLSDDQRRQLAVAGLGPDLPVLSATRIEELFAQRLQRSPTEIALVDNDRRWTVADVAKQVSVVEEGLIAQAIGRGDIVGIFLPRGTAIIAPILATLRRGAAFLLVDTDYPDERIAFMVRDSGAAVVITTAELAVRLPAGTSVLTEFPDSCGATKTVTAGTADDIAYIVYTSGSTGQPKAVMQTHRATLNRLAWMWNAFPFATDDVCCQKTALGFVDVISEMLGPLLGGAPLVFIPEEVRRDPADLIRFLAAERVTRIVLVPPLLELLLDHDDLIRSSLDRLRLWVCSGEPLTAELAHRFFATVPRALLLNLYGSSEVGADVTWERVARDSQHSPVMIGRPLDGTAVHVLDANLEPVPFGTPGEIWVGGAQLARGYLHRPGLTAERFLPDPFLPGGRLYRTGDLGIRHRDGRLQFLSRIDHQIKIAGCRIEPGEIEAGLKQLSGICDAIVVDLLGAEGTPATLEAAVTIEEGRTLDQAVTQAELRRRLPEFMVPSRIVCVAALPRLASGKIDRSAVRAVLLAEECQAAGAIPPATETEKQLASIWGALLRVREPGREANFFALGGHSILVMQLASRVAKAMHVDVPLRMVFEAPTLAQLAERIDALKTAPGTSALPEIKRRPRPERRINVTL
jgi:surfactin family lipopeptide synthetase C